jgi:ABC-type multidrug transport system fused ATPase/permease subunit
MDTSLIPFNTPTRRRAWSLNFGKNTHDTTPKTLFKDRFFSLYSDVCFAYPGSQKTTSALTNINLSISAGQLVVVVGANGSGKSTIIRLLSRLYNPDSGELLIDGKKANEYRLADLHESIAILSQDAKIYPLSLSENIGLGFPDQCANKEMVERAAQQGGASEFIKKLVNGLDTQLNPPTMNFSFNLTEYEDHPLQKELAELKREIDISGGERQRVVA